MRKPVSPSQILAVTLRFLATGESYTSLEYQFRISKRLLCDMIPYTCEMIFSLLKDEYKSCPQAEWEWEEISKQFEEWWQLLNCVDRAGDGKHIRIKCPRNSHSVSITKATLVLYLWHL